MDTKRFTRNYLGSQWHTQEGAFRCISHVLAGIALTISRGDLLDEAQIADLEEIAKEKSLWPETRKTVNKLFAENKAQNEETQKMQDTLLALGEHQRERNRIFIERARAVFRAADDDSNDNKSASEA